MPGVTVKDVNQQEFVRALAAFLKKSGKLKVPEWVDTVKLAKHKELAPYDENWFYTRAASTARHLYLRGGAGVGSMTKIYGGRQRNGVRPSHFSRGSKSVARRPDGSVEFGGLLCRQRIAFPALVHSKDFEEVRDPRGQPSDFSKGISVDRQPLPMFPGQADRQDLHTVSRHHTIRRGPHDGDFHISQFHKL